MQLRDTGSWKSPRRLALIAAGLALLTLGVWFSLPGPERDILVLDASAMTVVLDELPSNEQHAIACAEEEISNVTGVPTKAVERYFTLRSSSHTWYQWRLVYNVTDNPNLTVSLTLRISPDEGFAIANEYLLGLLGTRYFNAHVTPERFESTTNTAHYSFAYPLPGDGDEIVLPMWVQLSYERTVTGCQVVNAPQKIAVMRAEAEELARQQGVPEPFSSSPVIRNGIICWRVVWQHIPTEEDYDTERLYGVDIHARTGETLATLRYVRSKPLPPGPIVVAQLKALLERLNVTALEDGASFEVCVINSSGEVFTVTRSFGRLVVQQGGSADADITLWLDRALILQALEAADTRAYLKQHAGGGTIRVERHENVVVLQKKGYMQLYTQVKE
jgi:hypothetical protein